MPISTEPRLRWLAGAAALATAVAALPLPAQQREVPQPVEFVTAHDDSLYSLPRSQEDIHNLETAQAELQNGQLQAGLERLHKLLQQETGGVVPVAGGRFYGLRLSALLTLANLPPAAAAAYEQLVRREAGSLADRPLTDLSVDQLRLLADRFPAADVGRRARLRLGDLQFERGQGLAAASHYRQLLDAAPIGSSLEQRARDRLQQSTVLVDPRDQRGAAEAGSAAADLLSVLPAADDATDWPMPGGRYGGSGRMDEPAGRPQGQWAVEVAAHGVTYRGGAYSMFPVGDLQGIFVNDGVEVLAYDPLRQELLWQSDAPLRELGDLRRTEEEYEESYNENMVLAPALGRDAVVAALQVPENSENVDFRAGFRIINKIPERRLFAFDRRSGKLLWAHYDQLEGPLTRRYRGHTACGPPLVVGDTVYAPTHDRSNAIAFYLSAYELHTGKVRWRRLICSSQQDVNMFGNARTEFAASPLLAAGGVVYGSTNLGVCFAVDMHDGTVRWLSSYEVVPLPETLLHGQRDRQVYFANNPPALLQGVLACMPLDSQYVLGLDAETGKLAWRVPQQARSNGNNDVRWLLGSSGDEFVLAGAGVVGVAARPPVGANLIASVRSIQRPEYLRENRLGGGETPRPALTDQYVWFPVGSTLSVFDCRGTAAPHSGALRPQAPGNLLLVDGMLVSLRDRRLEFLFDRAALRARAEARLATDPDDPAAILRLASMQAALLDPEGGPAALQAVEQLYRRGLQAAERRGLPEQNPVRRQLAEQLYQIAFARARTARPAEAVPLLLQTRQAAPDLDAWMQVELELVAALQSDRKRLLAELDAAAAHAGAGTFAYGPNPALPVAAWVLWQKAQLQEPAAAVASWQELLERFGAARLDGRPAAELARAALEALLAEHGRGIYAAVEARAAAALAAAGNDEGALRGLSATFPHSEAAAAAQRRLLDGAVGRGDLRAVCEVLARAQQHGEAEAGLLRRALAAALQHGNAAFAAELAQRLQRRHADAASDWPADQGRRYGEVVAGLPQPPPAAAAPALQVPRNLLASIPAQSGQQLQPVQVADGFPAPADVPLYTLVHEPRGRNNIDEQLVAYDLRAPLQAPPVLFRFPVRFPDPVLLCGRVLIVADLQTVTGLDYRSGQQLWQLPNPDGDMYSCLGVQAGVLHLSVAAGRQGEAPRFCGIEPCTGALLFARSLAPDQYSRRLKGTGGQLLLFELQGDRDPVLHRLDPLTGLPATSITLDAAVLQQLGLQVDGLRHAKLFPLSLCADQSHVYLPIDAALVDGPCRIGALSDQGRLDWVWTGGRGRQLRMLAARGGRVVAVEADGRSGRAVLLRGSDGELLHAADLGESVQVYWQRSWGPAPAPAALLIGDRDPNDPASTARVTCFGIDDGVPTFAQALTPQDDNLVKTPFLGPDFVCFGVQQAARTGLRLYALRLSDRRGAFADGRKFLGLPGAEPYMLGTAGPYTVLASARQLMILGDEDHR